jgi:putative endonuclease
MYYTYVLRSAVKNMLYKGSTEDIQRRLLEHNSAMTNFTSKYRPWELVYFETFPTRSEAIRSEKFFKTGRGREFLNEVISSKGKK